MPPGKVLRYVDVHEEQGDLPAVERQPVHLRPGHLLTVDNRQAQGEGVVVVGRRRGNRLREVRGVRVGGAAALHQLVDDHRLAVHPNRRFRANNPVSAGSFQQGCE